MSELSHRLAQRSVTRGPRPGPSGADHVLTLLDLRPGESARITGYSEDLADHTCRRIFDLGFVPGAGVEAVRRAPARDPFIYRVAECEVAIRKDLARTVRVERV